MIYIVDHKFTVYVVFINLLTAEYKRNMKIMQRAEKSYSIDIVVLSRYINIPNITLFS